MKNFLAFALRRHPVLSGLFVLALVAFVGFAGRFVSDAVYFGNPANHNRMLETWMSPRFVAQSWDLPKPVIFEIMRMDMEGDPHDGPRTLADVMARTGMSLEDLQAAVMTAHVGMMMEQGR